MDIKQMLIAEFKNKDINFDEDKADYIDDSFDSVLECIEAVVNQYAFNKLNKIRESVKEPLLLVTEEINIILRAQPRSTKGGGCYKPNYDLNFNEDMKTM